MQRILTVVVPLVALALLVPSPAAAGRGRALFSLDACVPDCDIDLFHHKEQRNAIVPVLKDFVSKRGDFGLGEILAAVSVDGEFDYLGVERAILLESRQFGEQVILKIPSIGLEQEFNGPDADDVADQIEAWIQDDALGSWFDFLRAMNGITPLALISGNPKSTVALLGDGPYRRFGTDDSRSRSGYDEPVGRWGTFELRLDVGASSVNTGDFTEDLWTIDPHLTLAGEFTSWLGLSFSIIGQYRDYQGADLWDLGAEIGLPITLMRPLNGANWYWQLTPVIQAGGGVSKPLAAGGLIMGGGLVNSLGYNLDSWEFIMANEILYYGGIPVENIGGYDFETKLSQLYFKNGLLGRYWMGAGFYGDVGVSFTNFVLDDAAVSWFSTPAAGLGWQAGRWMDLKLSYEADLGDDYTSHNLQLKLDFLF